MYPGVVVALWLTLFSLTIPTLIKILFHIGIELFIRFPKLGSSPKMMFLILLTGISLGYMDGMLVSSVVNILVLTFNHVRW
jgi:hypothetical protein